MALFALLVAAIVSVVILTAATSNVRQAKADQEMEQSILTLQSAGELMADNLTNDTKTKFVYTCTTTEMYATESTPASVTVEKTLTGTGNSYLEEELKSGIKSFFTIDEEPLSKLKTGDDVAITAVSKDSSFSQEVKVGYTLQGSDSYSEEGADRRYQLNLTFTLGGDSKQTLYLELKGNCDQESSAPGSGDIIDKTTNIAVGKVDITIYTFTWSNPTFYMEQVSK